MLEANGYPAKGLGYLVYYYPNKVEENGLVTFNIKVVELKTDLERTKKVLKDAMKLLSGPIPPHHSECEYCLWGRNNGD